MSLIGWCSVTRLVSRPLTTLTSSYRSFATQKGNRTENQDEFTKRAEEDARKRSENRQRANSDQALKDKIFQASLEYVPSKGWSVDAIRLAATDLGYPDVVSGIAENGEIDLVHFHLRACSEKLREIMATEVESAEERSEKVKAGPFVKHKIATRLRMNVPYLEKWPEAIALMSMPQHFPKSLEYDLELIDDIWHYAGDKSTDHNWYTKRLSLLAIYKSTELAMLQDKSQDFKETWSFLERRFNEQKQLTGVMDSAKDLQNVVVGLASTLQNVLGLPRK